MILPTRPKLNNFLPVATLALIASLFKVSPTLAAVDNVCYLVSDIGGSNGGNDFLVKLNTDTGQFIQVSNGTGTDNIEAAAAQPGTNILFAANQEGSNGRLGTIDLITGIFNPLPGVMGTGNGIRNGQSVPVAFNDPDGLAFDPTDGSLYASIRTGDGSTPPDILIKLDPTTGRHIPNAFGSGIDFVEIQPQDNKNDIDGIAIDLNGTMYGIANQGSGGNQNLVTIDKTDGTTTFVNTITAGSINVGDVEDLAFDVNGQLYISTGNNGSQSDTLYALNTSTAAATNPRPITIGGDYEASGCFLLPPVDVSLNKTVDNSSPSVGDTVTFTLTLTNDAAADATGDPYSDANNIVIKDVLPAGLEFDSLVTTPTGSTASYDSGTRTLTWNVNEVLKGNNIVLQFRASATASGSVTNTAELTALREFDVDSVPDNNDDNEDDQQSVILAIAAGTARDYGDAPSNFDNNDLDRDTPIFADPAQHGINSNLYLGSVIPDSESSPQSSNNAGGDDAVANGSIDDEEGISSFPILRTDATTYSLTATVHNPNNLNANVYGWIDFDRDRQFDQDERATATSDSSGTVTLSWNINSNSGANILNGDTYVRIRVTTDDLDQTDETTLRDDASIGLATDGEVEDYPLTIQLAPIDQQSYCESIGGTLNPNNLFTAANNGTFGVGTAENQSSDLPANLTTYTYDPAFPPQDGEYVVSTRRTQVGFTTWHTMTGHTTGDVNDRFMIVNTNDQLENTEIIQSGTITGLTANSNYTFTAYILNTVEINPDHIDPNVSFGIDLVGVDDNDDGTVDEDKEVEIRFSSGDIPESPQPTWIRYSFLFNTARATSARFVLRSNKIGGFGNDLAIDDISLNGCDLPAGDLEGKLYYDNNGNDLFDLGEPGLAPGSTIRLINTQGNNDPLDDIIVTRLANSGGDYSFLNIPQGSNYQIVAPSQDSAGNPIGTTNPITGVTINSGQTTTNQNFGYDANSNLILVKRITAINPGKPDEIIFNGFENDPQDDNDDVANWSNKNVYLRGKINVENVKPEDEVEYTIYFLSNGRNAVRNLSLCDVIPDNMKFVENSYGSNIGIGLGLNSSALPTEPNIFLTNNNDSDLAEFYLPNSQPPTFCQKVDNTGNIVPTTQGNNTDGAVVLDLGTSTLPPATAPGTPTDSYGFVRFRAKVK